jgi:hypothetical protein
MAHPIPKIGDSVLLDLPSERTQGVVRVVKDKGKTIFAQVIRPTMHQLHKYRQGDVAGFRRQFNAMGDIIWPVDPALPHMTAAQAEQEQQRVAEK